MNAEASFLSWTAASEELQFSVSNDILANLNMYGKFRARRIS
jgi:hypothetical protein